MSVRYYCDRCGDRVVYYESIAINWTGPDIPALSTWARPGEMERGPHHDVHMIVCKPCNEAVARALANIMRPVEPREE